MGINKITVLAVVFAQLLALAVLELIQVYFDFCKGTKETASEWPFTAVGHIGQACEVAMIQHPAKY